METVDQVKTYQKSLNISNLISVLPSVTASKRFQLLLKNKLKLVVVNVTLCARSATCFKHEHAMSTKTATKTSTTIITIVNNIVLPLTVLLFFMDHAH